MHRQFLDDGTLGRDAVTLESEKAAGTKLLQPVMVGAKRLSASPATEALRAGATREVAALPAGLRGLDQAVEQYRLDISEALRELAAQVDAKTRAVTVT